MTPIEMMLGGIAWTQSDAEPPTDSDLPYATHSGVWEIGGRSLKCYRLNTGQAIFDAQDMESFMTWLADGGDV